MHRPRALRTAAQLMPHVSEGGSLPASDDGFPVLLAPWRAAAPGRPDLSPPAPPCITESPLSTAATRCTGLAPAPDSGSDDASPPSAALPGRDPAGLVSDASSDVSHASPDVGKGASAGGADERICELRAALIREKLDLLEAKRTALAEEKELAARRMANWLLLRQCEKAAAAAGTAAAQVAAAQERAESLDHAIGEADAALQRRGRAAAQWAAAEGGAQHHARVLQQAALQLELETASWTPSQRSNGNKSGPIGRPQANGCSGQRPKLTVADPSSTGAAQEAPQKPPNTPQSAPAALLNMLLLPDLPNLPVAWFDMRGAVVAMGLVACAKLLDDYLDSSCAPAMHHT